MLWFENYIKLASHELGELMGNSSVLEICEEIETQQMCCRTIDYSHRNILKIILQNLWQEWNF